MISGTIVKIFGIVLLIVVAVVLILGIGTLFKEERPVKNIQIN